MCGGNCRAFGVAGMKSRGHGRRWSQTRPWKASRAHFRSSHFWSGGTSNDPCCVSRACYMLEAMSPMLSANCQLPCQAHVPHAAVVDSPGKWWHDCQVGLPPKLSLLPLGQHPSRWDFNRRVTWSDSHFRKTPLVTVRRWNDGGQSAAWWGTERTGPSRDEEEVAEMRVWTQWEEGERGGVSDHGQVRVGLVSAQAPFPVGQTCLHPEKVTGNSSYLFAFWLRAGDRGTMCVQKGCSLDCW